MDDFDADAVPRVLSDYLVPTLWRADEAQRRMPDVDFEPVFKAAIDAAGRHELLSSFAKYLEGSETPVELSTLVALPDDGEAHFIDTTTHLISALLISAATDDRLLRGLAVVGRALRHQREQIDRVATGLVSLESRTVSPIRERIGAAAQALRDAVDEGERNDWERIAALAIDPEVLAGLQVDVQARILGEFTRTEMVSGPTKYSVDGRLPWRRLTLPVRMPRSMLLEVPSDADFLAENLARGFAEGELSLLESQLRRTRTRTFGVDDLKDRLLAAAAVLPADAEDLRALVPVAWDVVRQLGENVRWARNTENTHVGGRLGPLRIIQVPFDESDSCYVVAAPGPFELVVRGEAEEWLRLSVEEVAADAQVAGPPQVRLIVDEEVVYRVTRGHVLRIAIPGSTVVSPTEGSSSSQRRNSRRARLR